MNPIINLRPNELIWFNSHWEKPTQRYNIELVPLKLIFLVLLTILLFWFGIAYLVSLSSNSSWIIFITLILWVGGIIYYTFPSQENQLIPFFLLTVPPALSIIFGIILQQDIIGIIISSFYLIVILFLWGKKVTKEIEREPFFVILSAISLFISFITLVFEFLPPSFSASVYNVYPFFAPIIIFWTNSTFLVIRAIAGVLIFIAAFAMAITLVKAEGLLIDVKKIEFGKLIEQSNRNVLNSFINSLIKLFNSVIIPTAEIITFTLFIIFSYIVTTVVYFFRSLIFNISYVSIAIAYRFVRFIIIPVGVAGITMFVLFTAAFEINHYIHFNDINPLQFMLRIIIMFFIIPFTFLYSQRASIIREDFQLYLTSIILPNVWLYLLLVIVSVSLVLLHINPYYFGILSWSSVVLWGIGSLFIISLFFKKKKAT